MEPDPRSVEALEARVSELEAALARAEHDATVDALTGVLNRRGWDLALSAENDRCRRHDLDASVLVVDIVGLKAVNDDAGHHAGDRLLQRCAVALRGAMRAHDVIARTGGDEFAVLAVHAQGGSATEVESRVRAALLDHEVECSVGAALRSSTGALETAWIAADHRMVQRKGGTRITRS